MSPQAFSESSLPHYSAQQNPFIGQNGIACMHGDSQSSDTTPLAGPGIPKTGQWEVRSVDLGGACPTIMVGNDGLIQVLATKRIGSNFSFLQPCVYVLDPESGDVLGSLECPKGSLLGGVYAFLDEQDRMVFVDGSNTLIRVAHDASGANLHIDSRVSLGSFLAMRKGDQVVGVVPDWQGHIWIASAHGGVAVVDLESRRIQATVLNAIAAEETVDNSISASPSGVVVASSHALYMLNSPEVDASGSNKSSGKPRILWHQPYDRGSARKPGQLSWGTGASPTFFGPTGAEFVAITDNADNQEHILVFDAATGSPLPEVGVFSPGQSGTECSLIGIDKTIIASCSYGYPYPRVPDNAGQSVPHSAAFAPGLERWDVDTSASTLRLSWRRDDVYCAVVPRYSAADGLIYLCERKPFGAVDGVRISAAAIDMKTGQTVHTQDLPGIITVFGVDTLQMVGTIDSNGTWWQGTVGGVFRISSR